MGAFKGFQLAPDFREVPLAKGKNPEKPFLRRSSFSPFSLVARRYVMTTAERKLVSSPDPAGPVGFPSVERGPTP